MALPVLVPATIAASGSLSPEVDLGINTLVGIQMPSAWTAAGLTFQVSSDGGVTWNEMTTSSGSAVNFTVAAGQYIAVDPTLWRGVNALKIRSGALGTSVPQAVQAVLTLVTRCMV